MSYANNLKYLFETINKMSYFETKEFKSTKHWLSYYFQDTILYNYFKCLNDNIYINLYCTNCDKEQVFNSKLYKIDGNYFYLENYCKICSKYFYSYFILVMNTNENNEYEYIIQKSGSTIETSKLEIPNQDLKELMQEELYKKAILSFKNGLYTGSYIYFRKLLENKIDEILIELDIFLEKKNNRFEDKLKKLVENKIFENKGIYKTLYKNLSEAVHSLTEEECKTQFILIKYIFEFAIRNINFRKQLKKEEQETQKLLSNLNNTQMKIN